MGDGGLSRKGRVVWQGAMCEEEGHRDGTSGVGRAYEDAREEEENELRHDGKPRGALWDPHL
jgi:hypothetical protein